jgi:hypothetical protein
MTNPHADPRTDPRWRGLFAAAATGALLTALFIPLQVVVFIAWPPPASHSLAAWFELFTDSPLLGLVSLDLLMMVEQVLLIPVVLAIWILVHRASESAALLGAALWLSGGLLILASNTGFEMLSLARGYAASAPAEQGAYLGAAQGMLASYWDMGTSFVFGYLLASTGGILAGVAMVRARLFGRAAGWVVVVANAIGLGIFMPGVGVVLALASVLMLWGWFLRIGWGFLRLARGDRRREARLTSPSAADPVAS